MAKQEPEVKSIILWATSTSRPSKFSTTVRLLSKVSVTSRESSKVFGLITHTSIALPCFLEVCRIGVTFWGFVFTGVSSS